MNKAKITSQDLAFMLENFLEYEAEGVFSFMAKEYGLDDPAFKISTERFSDVGISTEDDGLILNINGQQFKLIIEKVK